VSGGYYATRRIAPDANRHSWRSPPMAPAVGVNVIAIVHVEFAAIVPPRTSRPSTRSPPAFGPRSACSANRQPPQIRQISHRDVFRLRRRPCRQRCRNASVLAGSHRRRNILRGGLTEPYTAPAYLGWSATVIKRRLCPQLGWSVGDNQGANRLRRQRRCWCQRQASPARDAEI